MKPTVILTAALLCVLSPCPTHGHHWYANAESCFLIGEAAGEEMKKLLQ